MTLYMAVTADKYELPLVVGTLYQVAEYGGVQLKTVQQSISLKRSGRLNGFKYVRVKWRMTMNLDRAHRKIEHDKISREVRTAVENKVIPKVQSACLAATALVLHDKFGFGKQRLNKYIEEVFSTFESIYLNYTDFEDIKRCIYDELGIDFDAIEKKREDELKAV